jgi:hypothetical protein
MPKFRPLPPVETLREWLHYDPTTGHITWLRKNSNRAVVGSIAGHVDQRGYRRVSIETRKLLAHRVAWAIHYGADPGEMEIDHRDGNKSNNRIDNLRLATKPNNGHNARTRSDNTSGVKGVSLDRRRGTWVAQVVDGTTRHSRAFPTIEEATAAIRTAREKLHGEFAHHG